MSQPYIYKHVVMFPSFVIVSTWNIFHIWRTLRTGFYGTNYSGSWGLFYWYWTITVTFRRRSEKASKLHVTGLCVGTSPGTYEFPAQMASNVENVSISWRHHVLVQLSLNLWHVLISDKLSQWFRPLLANVLVISISKVLEYLVQPLSYQYIRFCATIVKSSIAG